MIRLHQFATSLEAAGLMGKAPVEMSRDDVLAMAQALVDAMDFRQVFCTLGEGVKVCRGCGKIIRRRPEDSDSRWQCLSHCSPECWSGQREQSATRNA